MDDLIYRQKAIATAHRVFDLGDTTDLNDLHYLMVEALEVLPPAKPEEVIPHRNYKYFSDYWCKCGWHLGKKGDVKYCAECGRKVKWDG